MARLIRPLANLHEQLRRLPGIGSKTALRLAYHIINMPAEDVQRLAAALVDAKRQVCLCRTCYNLSDKPECGICSDPGRDKATICVVEQPQDVMAMERSRGYRGLYHVLHGALSPLDGIGPDNLRIKELLRRLQQGEVKEVILATNSNVEGEATAAYLAQLLKPRWRTGCVCKKGKIKKWKYRMRKTQSGKSARQPLTLFRGSILQR